MRDIFYCEKFPVGEINFSTKFYHEGSEEWRPALADNIREHGLVNPLYMVNDRGPHYAQLWLKTGNNRLWAIKSLGWSHVPVIITGSCPHPCKKITVKEANALLGDGYFVWEMRHWGMSLELKGMCLAADGEYPSDKEPNEDHIKQRLQNT